ncbi:hypothetical protein W97_03079 [Coniosporium apollinis CBS 100218]|uniref:Beta-hexosaminidase n=1 Tax=Coniosporium apollinis (strain CBS 100218) TaxID=1168221 RepID=R7YQA3_CONA1|nr:uncharacterized protein W97_03079 [Coniosporium apollinis CBS 100218]EON63851.1 hypothetical protein W97_03079 [Coniosporium apollinis CBS 100218]
MRSLAALTLLTPFAAAIWPLPSSYTSGDTVLWIDGGVQISYNAANNVGSIPVANALKEYAPVDPQLTTNPQSYPHSYWNKNRNSTAGHRPSQQIIQYAIQRTYDTILKKNFVPWKFHERNEDFEPPTEGKIYISHISLQQNAADPDNILTPRAGDVDESYSLTLTEDGEATIEAETSIGLVRGLTTFTQLFYKHSAGGAYTPFAPVEIEDEPKFPHRGLNMDTARNYFSVSDIKRTIDAMAYNKFNRLHWHITDAQSWPLEIPALPELAAKGAYRRDLTYTPGDFEEIQYFAAIQGVEVIVEIDMPGHTSSIWFSQPELIAAFNAQPDWNTYCAEPPCGSLKLNSTAVYDFLGTMWDDLLPRVRSSYFHTGGDEVNINTYLLDDTVRSNDTAVLQPLMQRFIDFNHDRVREAGLTPVVWEEMLLTWNLTLGDDVVIQTWQSDEAVAEVVAAGHKALVGNYNYWYLDCGKGQWIDFAPGFASQKYFPYNDYCSPRKNWRLMYSYDPLHGIPANSSHLVLGGECHIWAEQTDPINFDDMVWPRACAAAEVLWSGAKDENGQNRSQIEASPRLSEMRERLVARGVRAEPIQMPFCIMNGTQCSLAT